MKVKIYFIIISVIFSTGFSTYAQSNDLCVQLNELYELSTKKTKALDLARIDIENAKALGQHKLMVRSEVIWVMTGSAAIGAGILSFLINRASVASGNSSLLGGILALVSTISAFISISVSFYTKSKYKNHQVTIIDYQSIVDKLSESLELIEHEINNINKANQCI